MSIFTNKDISKLDWLGASQSHTQAVDDVTITRYTDDRIGITFKDGCHKKMSSCGAYGRIEFAVFNDATMVFRCSKDGYKLQPSGSANSVISFSIKNVDPDLKAQILSFLGSYKLRYESTFKLWYISKAN